MDKLHVELFRATPVITDRTRSVTVAEACALLHLDKRAAAAVIAGPFAAQAGMLDIRQVLGCAVILALPMLKGKDAVSIALVAAAEARADHHRVLVVGWQAIDKPPVASWQPGILASDILRPLMAIPADRLLAGLQECLIAHRAERALAN